jgi:hypothetical protein
LIFDEADRHDHACVHIENPLPPILVFGCPVEEARTMHDAMVLSTKATLPNGSERALRIDQNTLLTVVASHPFSPEEILSSPDKMKTYTVWETQTIAWLSRLYGSAVKTAVRHVDESHAHIHVFILPDDLRANALHPGTKARDEARAAAVKSGATRTMAQEFGDNAYKDAMILWQTRYHDDVTSHLGLGRGEGGSRRVTRGEWYMRKIESRIMVAEKTESHPPVHL